MRLVSLLPLLSTLSTIVLVSAAPIEQTIPVGGNTVAVQAPTIIPNIKLPVPPLPTATPTPTAQLKDDLKHKGVPDAHGTLPVRRADHINDISSREIRNADYSISPNATFTALTGEKVETNKEKRGLFEGSSGRTAPPERHAKTPASRTTRNQRGSSHAAQRNSAKSKPASNSAANIPILSGSTAEPGSVLPDLSKAAASPGEGPAGKSRPEHHPAPGRGDSAPGPPSGSPFAAISQVLQTFGSGPDVIGNVVNTLPLESLSNTPLTSPDTGSNPNPNKVAPPHVPSTDAADPNAITAGVPEPAAISDAEKLPSDIPNAKDGVPNAQSVPKVEGETIPEAEGLPKETEAEIPAAEGAAQNEGSRLKQRRSDSHSIIPPRLISRDDLPVPGASKFLSPITDDKATGLSPSNPEGAAGHSIKLSTDPLVRPQPDANGQLPADFDRHVGLVNVDSNRKSEVPAPLAAEASKAPIAHPPGLPGAAGEKKTKAAAHSDRAPASGFATTKTKSRRDVGPWKAPVNLDSSGLKYKHL